MTDRHVAEQLAAALTVLPGGPLTAPADLGQRGARRLIRRRRAQVTAVLAVTSLIAGGAALAVDRAGARRPVPQPAGPVEPRVEATGCPGVPELTAAAKAPTHTAAQAVAAAGAADFGTLSASTRPATYRGNPVWVLSRLHLQTAVVDGPARAVVASQTATVISDVDLQRVGRLTCTLSPALARAWVETTHPPAASVDASAQAAEPVSDLEDGDASTPWSYLGPTADGLVMTYGTSCHEQRSIQSEETEGYVLIQLVRRGPASHTLCASREGHAVVLRAPLGNRQLLHAPVREISPTAYKAALHRTPTALPAGSVKTSDTTTPRSHRVTWQVDGATLVYAAGFVPPAGDFVAHTSVGGHPARVVRTVDGTSISWEEGGIGVYASVNRSPASDSLIDQLPHERALLNRLTDSGYISDYIGLTLEQAQRLASANGLHEVRVFLLERRPQAQTASYDPRRLDVEILDGRIRGGRFG